MDIVIDHTERKNLIENKFNIILKKRNIFIDSNPKLLQEVVDFVVKNN